MLPEIQDILHILQRVQQKMVSPFLPINGHGAIAVHARNGVGTGSVPGLASVGAASLHGFGEHRVHCLSLVYLFEMGSRLAWTLQ